MKPEPAVLVKLRAALEEVDAELAAMADYCATRGFVTRRTGAEITRARAALASAYAEFAEAARRTSSA